MLFPSASQWQIVSTFLKILWQIKWPVAAKGLIISLFIFNLCFSSLINFTNYKKNLLTILITYFELFLNFPDSVKNGKPPKVS